MSSWTHITATFDVDTFRELDREQLKQYVEEKLKDAPKITGSEGNADLFVNVLNGHNVWKGADCEVCQYGETKRNADDGFFTCDAPVEFDCPSGKYQTRVVITLIGDLRDRLYHQTKSEYDKLYEFVDKTFGDLRNSSVSIIS